MLKFEKRLEIIKKNTLEKDKDNKFWDNEKLSLADNIFDSLVKFSNSIVDSTTIDVQKVAFFKRLVLDYMTLILSFFSSDTYMDDITKIYENQLELLSKTSIQNRKDKQRTRLEEFLKELSSELLRLSENFYNNKGVLFKCISENKLKEFLNLNYGI